MSNMMFDPSMFTADDDDERRRLLERLLGKGRGSKGEFSGRRFGGGRGRAGRGGMSLGFGGLRGVTNTRRFAGQGGLGESYRGDTQGRKPPFPPGQTPFPLNPNMLAELLGGPTTAMDFLPDFSGSLQGNVPDYSGTAFPSRDFGGGLVPFNPAIRDQLPPRRMRPSSRFGME